MIVITHANGILFVFVSYRMIDFLEKYDRCLPYRIRCNTEKSFYFCIERIVKRSPLADDIKFDPVAVKTYHQVEEIGVVHSFNSNSTVAIRLLPRRERRIRRERIYRILKRRYQRLEAKYRHILH